MTLRMCATYSGTACSGAQTVVDGTVTYNDALQQLQFVPTQALAQVKTGAYLAEARAVDVAGNERTASWHFLYGFEAVFVGLHPSNASWHEPQNWQGGRVPLAGASVLVHSSVADVLVDGPVFVNSLVAGSALITIKSSAQLSVGSGTLGEVELQGTLVALGGSEPVRVGTLTMKTGAVVTGGGDAFNTVLITSSLVVDSSLSGRQLKGNVQMVIGSGATGTITSSGTSASSHLTIANPALLVVQGVLDFPKSAPALHGDGWLVNDNGTITVGPLDVDILVHYRQVGSHATLRAVNDALVDVFLGATDRQVELLGGTVTGGVLPAQPELRLFGTVRVENTVINMTAFVDNDAQAGSAFNTTVTVLDHVQWLSPVEFKSTSSLLIVGTDQVDLRGIIAMDRSTEIELAQQSSSTIHQLELEGMLLVDGLQHTIRTLTVRQYGVVFGVGAASQLAITQFLEVTSSLLDRKLTGNLTVVLQGVANLSSTGTGDRYHLELQSNVLVINEGRLNLVSGSVGVVGSGTLENRGLIYVDGDEVYMNVFFKQTGAAARTVLANDGVVDLNMGAAGRTMQFLGGRLEGGVFGVSSLQPEVRVVAGVLTFENTVINTTLLISGDGTQVWVRDSVASHGAVDFNDQSELHIVGQDVLFAGPVTTGSKMTIELTAASSSDFYALELSGVLTVNGDHHALRGLELTRDGTIRGGAPASQLEIRGYLVVQNALVSRLIEGTLTVLLTGTTNLSTTGTSDSTHLQIAAPAVVINRGVLNLLSGSVRVVGTGWVENRDGTINCRSNEGKILTNFLQVGSNARLVMQDDAVYDLYFGHASSDVRFLGGLVLGGPTKAPEMRLAGKVTIHNVAMWNCTTFVDDTTAGASTVWIGDHTRLGMPLDMDGTTRVYLNGTNTSLASVHVRRYTYLEPRGDRNFRIDFLELEGTLYVAGLRTLSAESRVQHDGYGTVQAPATGSNTLEILGTLHVPSASTARVFQGALSVVLKGTGLVESTSTSTAYHLQILAPATLVVDVGAQLTLSSGSARLLGDGTLDNRGTVHAEKDAFIFCNYRQTQAGAVLSLADDSNVDLELATSGRTATVTAGQIRGGINNQPELRLRGEVTWSGIVVDVYVIVESGTNGGLLLIDGPTEIRNHKFTNSGTVRMRSGTVTFKSTVGLQTIDNR